MAGVAMEPVLEQYYQERLTCSIRLKRPHIEEEVSVFTIGSGDIRVQDVFVSERHIKVEYRRSSNTCYVTDLDSELGTFVQGFRIEPRLAIPLRVNETLSPRCSSFQFILKYCEPLSVATDSLTAITDCMNELKKVWPGGTKSEIWKERAKMKYVEWESESARRLDDLNKLKEACKSKLESEEQLEALEKVFEKAVEDDITTEIPDYLCCSITYDIFREPVVAPNGVTYEKSAILRHLTENNNMDPLTRKPLYFHELVPNLAISKAVKEYLDKHGWAYKMEH